MADKDIYINRKKRVYYSDRYDKTVTIPIGFASDGATGVKDVGDSWWFHDWLYFYGRFDDDTRCTKKQADQILADILKAEGRWFKSFYWKLGVKIFAKKVWTKHREQEIYNINKFFYEKVSFF